MAPEEQSGDDAPADEAVVPDDAAEPEDDLATADDGGEDGAADDAAGGDAPQVAGEDVAEGRAAEDEPVVVTSEVQPDTEEVVDVEPEGEPEPEMLHGVRFGYSRGQVVLHPDREQYPELVARLREAGYLACLDVTAVDYLGFGADRALPPGVAPERFELVAIFLDHAARDRIRVRVQVPERDPSVASIVSLHPGAENPEREVYDMYGITFEGHPDLTRILMPDEWEGYPLRKDSHSGRIPVQFKDTASGH